MGVFFGDRIRNARKAAGLTQRQLADSLGVSNTSISNWEKGLSRPDADMIQKLCHLLGQEPNYFYGNENAPGATPKRAVNDEDIKFALFGGDGEITDAMYDEVKRFAAFLKAREAGKKE
ncbi:MAG: helix-turn-helix transcriptional regulator [Oscillospiraceae bacterium]|nr:helix-turn-helix transcriptional regulator [Oscillospiraceae bacterium]